MQPVILGNIAGGNAMLACYPSKEVFRGILLGVTAIIQPGGSIRDKDSIKAADEHNIAMVFTGVRHFRH